MAKLACRGILRTPRNRAGFLPRERVWGGSVVFFQRRTGSSAESVRRREARRARGTRSILVRIRITRVLGNSSAIAFSTEKQREFWR